MREDAALRSSWQKTLLAVRVWRSYLLVVVVTRRQPLRDVVTRLQRGRPRLRAHPPERLARR